MSDDSFGQRLRAMREAAGLSRDALAHAAGLSVSALIKLEQGVVADPSWSSVRALARALGVSTAAFEETTSEPPPVLAPEAAPKRTPRKGKRE
jgi:transcriptional regulator with XRE-family HTH domain